MSTINIHKSLLSIAVGLAISSNAVAEVKLYDKDGTSFSTSGSFNTFFVNSDSSVADGTSRSQSRVKMGFLPNWINFDFGKQVGDLKLGGKSSFWVTINDSNSAITSTGIDVRQFYATVDADWGQLLVGKDFTLFSRSNIFLDEMLQGYGNVNDTLGLIDGQGVSFGNIGSGYHYPFPTAQITYRSPKSDSGLAAAVGIVDPGNTTTDVSTPGNPRGSEESTPRIEGEFTYSGDVGGGSLTAWLGFLQQKSESATQNVSSSGTSYGAKFKIGRLALHVSGFSGEGLGLLLGPGADWGLYQAVGAPSLHTLIYENGKEVDSDGMLVQASYTMGKSRFVASTGETEVKTTAQTKMEGTQLAWFHSYNANMTTVVEFDTNDITLLGGAKESVDTIAVGLIVNF
jgi:predicted porin